MPNIKFNYLYRDGGNFKNYSCIVFANPTNVELSVVESLIKSKLIWGEWFYVDEWNLPDLHFDTWNNQLDHTFHEFENVEYTDDPADEQEDGLFLLADFVAVLERITIADWASRY